LTTPRDILEVADDLSAGSKEAEWRSAVSRAYYAAFHGARLLLQNCGFAIPRGEDAHSYLWLRLSNAGHPDVKDAGKQLNQFRQMRNWADYDLDRQFDQATAMGYVVTADGIVELLEQIGNESSIRTTITETVKAYERDVLRQMTWHS